MSTAEAVTAYLQGRIDRREFIKSLVAVGVTAGAAVSYADVLAAPGSTGQLRALAQAGDMAGSIALTEDELRAVEAIAARIVPTTATPGAIEAGAANYIDLALSDAYAPSLARYQQSLAQLDAFCVASAGGAFATLSAEAQDGVLEDLEGGRITEVTGGPAFFELVLRHVMEGMFCEPIYGGNRDLVGWSLVGFPGQRFGYADSYINQVVNLPPVAVDGFPGRETQG